MKKTEIEILPSAQELLRGSIRQEELRKLVQQQVAEIMAERDALAFEPFFRSRQVAYELKRLQSVPEQEKFSIGYERYGCIDCKTQDRPHAGNGLCNTCRVKWFHRFAQIIAEGIKGEPARSGTGAMRAERLLPPTGPQDGVHRTWNKRSSRGERQLFGRIAAELGVHPSHVREVARGRSKSDTVIAALKAEGVPILTEGKVPVGRHPNTLAALAKSRHQRLSRTHENGGEE
jgi:hypothetical protein